MKISLSAKNRNAGGVFMNFIRAAAAKVVAGVRQRRVRRAHLRQLDQLLDREDLFLRDMGLNRHEVYSRAAALRRLF